MGICIQSQNKIQMIGNWKQKDEHKQHLKYRNHSEHLIALSEMMTNGMILFLQ